MRRAVNDRVSRGKYSIAVSGEVLAALDPAAVLQRGYAALQRVDDGLPVFSVAQAEPGTRIIAFLSDGALESSVGVTLPRSPSGWSRDEWCHGPPPTLESITTLVEEGAFEETLLALELVVEHLERGQLTMDQSIAWYEAGLRLKRRCSHLLEQAELRISELDAESPAHARSDHRLINGPSWDSDGS